MSEVGKFPRDVGSVGLLAAWRAGDFYIYSERLKILFD